MVQEKGYSHRLVVSKETFDLITKQCREEILDNNPDLEGMYMSHNFIVKRIGKFFMRW